jgi:hypothetical protein
LGPLNTIRGVLHAISGVYLAARWGHYCSNRTVITSSNEITVILFYVLYQFLWTVNSLRFRFTAAVFTGPDPREAH